MDSNIRFTYMTKEQFEQTKILIWSHGIPSYKEIPIKEWFNKQMEVANANK